MKPTKNNEQFTFAMELTKAFGEQNADGHITRMTIKGVASNTRRDKEDHQMTLDGLTSIQKAIENGVIDDDGEWDYVPLRSGHRSEWEDKLGSITKAEIDDDENLWITAELDPDSSKAKDLYIKVSKGNAVGRKPQLGLSVKGQATKYHFGMDPDSQSRVTYLDNIIIEEVSVTSKPKNPTPYPLAIAKSLLADPNYAQALRDDENASMTHDSQSHKEEPMTQISNNATVADDPIAKAIEKAHETVNDSGATNQNTEESQEQTQTDQVVTHTNDAQVTTEEAEEVQEDRSEGAEDIQRQEAPQGYANHPTTANNNTEAQTEAQEDTSESANQNEQLSSVLQAVESLRSEVENLKNQQNQPVEAQKAETVTETPAESVTLAEPENMDDRIALAVTKAFDQLGFKTVVDEIAVMKSSLEAIQNEPNDKSISVSKAKDEDDANDPYVRMRKLREEGVDPLSAALQTAYPQQK